MRLAAVATLVSSAAHFAPAQAAYSLTKAYQGDTFFDDWEFYGACSSLGSVVLAWQRLLALPPTPPFGHRKQW